LKLFTTRHGNQLKEREREREREWKNTKRLLKPNHKEVGHMRRSVIFKGHYKDSKSHCGDDAACIA